MSNKSQDIITLQNTDDEDFMFEYNASEGNPAYLTRAGEVARFPRFLAQHALKHLIDKILNKRGDRTNNRVLRLELADSIIIDTEKVSQVAELSDTQKLAKKVESLNQPSTLDTILAKRKVAKKHVEEKVKKEVKGKIEEEFEGLKDRKEEPEKPVEKKVKKPVEKPIKKPKKGLPTKNELIEHAKTKMKMVMDEKTEVKLRDMTVPELIKAVQYE